MDSIITAQLAFIPFPAGLDAGEFNSYDSMHGFGCCVYVDQGIVCGANMGPHYVKLMADAARVFGL